MSDSNRITDARRITDVNQVTNNQEILSSNGVIDTASLLASPVSEEAESSVQRTNAKLVLRRSWVEFEQTGVNSFNNVVRGNFTYVVKEGKQYYYRTSEGEATSKIVKGYRSKLTVEKTDGSVEEFDCIERANNFVNASSGIHTVTLITRNSKREIFLYGNFLIHIANYPCQLDGCIAPGTEVWEGYGVKNTRKALDNIINALGGWENGKTFEMEIFN